MSMPILATKLYIPPPPSQSVFRSRLIDQLNNGLSRKFSLISAPAGFGKSTLVSEWLHQKHHDSMIPEWMAWLSLDEGDNNPIRFLTYLVSALQVKKSAVGQGALSMLQSSQPPPTETILIALLNELTTRAEQCVLVLDDYHLIHSQEVDSALTFLLDHLPSQMNIVMTTREDPQLPLARLRARGDMVELRANDLRFTLDEASEFLNQSMALSLSTKEINALEKRTEGWIVGLRLAALSMQGHQDVTGFIQSFAGSHRFVLDYLVAEVLQRQSETVRDFLMKTAVLDRLNRSLCDAVTEQDNSRNILETLERENLFVIPLDDQRQWYRYHHLFADVLRTFALDERPEQMLDLHKRASIWYQQNGYLPEAAQHALASQDMAYAADLLELARPEMDSQFQSALWLAWVQQIPENIISNRPVLSASYGWALLDCGQMETSEARFQVAERWLDTKQSLPTPNEAMIVIDEEQFDSLPSSIATARAYRALAIGDIPGAISYAQQALALLNEGDIQWHGAASSLLGLAQYATGDLQAAVHSLTEFMETMLRGGRILDAISISFILAEIHTTLGQLHAAQQLLQRALHIAAEQGDPPTVGTSDLHRGLSELLLERYDLNGAEEQLRIGQNLGEKASLTGWPHRLCISQAYLAAIRGEVADALALLDEAERIYIRTPLPDVRPIPAMKVRLWVQQGRLSDAQAWASQREFSTEEALNFLNEYDQLTRIRIQIAHYQSSQDENAIHEVLAMLKRLAELAEGGGRRGTLLEILVLQALTYEAKQDRLRAVATVTKALKLAESEGYTAVFLNEGLPIVALLNVIEQEAGEAAAYARKLLAAYHQDDAGMPPRQDPSSVSYTLLEPLSERELDVLKMLATDLSGPEIARELMVSLNTVRTHTKNIYSKLGVHNRRTAVRRAQELNLL